MAFVPIPQTVSAEFIFNYYGVISEYVLWFHCADPLDEDNAEDLAAALKAWWVTNMRVWAVPSLSLVQIRITDQEDQHGFVVNYGTGLPSAGSDTGDGMPGNVALVMTKRTNHRGRSYRGRIYTFGFAEDQVAGNTVSPTITSAFTTAFNLLQSLDVGGVVWVHVVVSRVEAGDPREIGMYTPVTSITTDGQVDSQRRRLR